MTPHFFPVLKAGLVLSSNSVTDDHIVYDRQHRAGLYIGAGGGWQFADRWRAVAEVVSYDHDERVMSLGLHARF